MRPANLIPSLEKSVSGDEFSAITDYWQSCITHYPTFEKTASGFEIAAGVTGFNSAGSVTLGVPAEILVDGEVNPPGQIDAYGINLVAGQTYLFSARGSGANPLADSFLYVIDDDLATVLDYDDDGGSRTNSLLTYTATYTGLHYIGVGAYPGSGLTGTYTLDALGYPGGDVVSDDPGLAIALPQNGVTFGFIDSGAPGPYGPGFGEVDTYKIQVEAGKIYTIELAGGADGESNYLALPPGELDTVLVVYRQDFSTVASNDDISFPNDISSRVSFLATEDATYYIDAFSYSPWTGGFTITTQEIDLADLDPLDALNWFSADTIDTVNNTATVYFAQAGETFGEGGASYGWNATEKAAIFAALEQYTKILGINYVETNDSSTAEFRLITTTSTQFGAYFYPQDPAYGTQQGIGAFNVNSGGWTSWASPPRIFPGTS